MVKPERAFQDKRFSDLLVKMQQRITRGSISASPEATIASQRIQWVMDAVNELK